MRNEELGMGKAGKTILIILIILAVLAAGAFAVVENSEKIVKK